MIMTRHPIGGPIAGISRHRANLLEVNFRRIGFPGETSHSHQSATAGKGASSTNAMEPYAERRVSRRPNSAVEQSHRTRCTSS